MRSVNVEQDPAISLPVLGFGTYHLLDRVNKRSAEKSIVRAYDSGVRLIDTSDNYMNEAFIGSLLAVNELTDMYVATKTGLATSKKEFLEMRLRQRPIDASPDRMRRQLEASIGHLGRQTIDLYQVHAYDPYTPEIDVAEAMNQFIDERKINHWGVSNYTSSQLQKMLEICDAHDLVRPSTIQPPLSLFGPAESDVVADLARQERMVVLAHSPLMKGLLADASVDLVEAVLAEEDGVAPTARPIVETTFSYLSRARLFANSHGYTLSEYALAWLANQPQTVVLNSCVKEGQLTSSTRAVAWEIPAEGMRLAEEIRQDSDVQSGAHALMLAVAHTKPYYAKRKV